ncbi:hypothetical protein Q1695_006619 [Nippostrongylus brasiliensis]|nr:hypothetical protein Q1695_006619 [Nippostrongylus brasiliensis]
MNSITTSATINALKKVFSQFGNPSTLVTDNGTQFTSSLFKDFCVNRGIKHVRSPPFHPQSNGQAERFVDTFKRALIKLKDEEGTTADAIQTFLMTYRSTPCPSAPSHLTPAENFLGRRIRTELDLMLPPTDDNGLRDIKMEEQFKRQHGARHRHFQAEDAVYVKDYRHQKPTWTAGTILRRQGNTTYTVRVGDLTWIRHANQIRPRSSMTVANKLLDAFDMPLFTDDYDKDSPPYDATPPTPTIPRRSTRARRPPPRLDVNPRKKRYDSN